jgi:hypothetical protein
MIELLRNRKLICSKLLEGNQVYGTESQDIETQIRTVRKLKLHEPSFENINISI